MVCTFELELLERLAPGETWRFLRAAQDAVETAGGLWDGDMMAGVVMLELPQGEVMAEWERKGNVFRVAVAHPDVLSCAAVESAVRQRAASWLAPTQVAQQPLEGEPVGFELTVTPTAKTLPPWVWWVALGGVGVAAAAFGIAYLTRTKKRKRRKRR